MRSAALVPFLAAAAIAWGATIGVAQEPAASLDPPPAAPIADAEQQRRDVWDSPEMAAAREWLVDYFGASDRMSVDEERAYLERLRGLSADELREWLTRLEDTRRSANERRGARQTQRLRAAEAGLRFQRAQQEVYLRQQTITQRQREAAQLLQAQQRAARLQAAQQQRIAGGVRASVAAQQRFRQAGPVAGPRPSFARNQRFLRQLDQQELIEDLSDLLAETGSIPTSDSGE